MLQVYCVAVLCNIIMSQPCSWKLDWLIFKVMVSNCYNSCILINWWPLLLWLCISSSQVWWVWPRFTTTTRSLAIALLWWGPPLETQGKWKPSQAVTCSQSPPVCWQSSARITVLSRRCSVWRKVVLSDFKKMQNIALWSIFASFVLIMLGWIKKWELGLP